MSAGEKARYRWRQVRGLVQDYVGRATGKRGKRVSGHGKMVGGEVQYRAADARDDVRDGARKATGRDG